MNTKALDLDVTSLRDLFDGVSDLVQSVLPDGTIRFVNRKWLERLGYTLAEVEGRNISEIIHPESRECCMRHLKRLLSGEELGATMTIYVTKSGEMVRLEGKVTIAFESGVPIAARGVFREMLSNPHIDAAAAQLREERRMFHSVLSILRGNMNRGRRKFLELVTQQVGQALGVARASIWLLDPMRQRIACDEICIDGVSQGKTAMVLHRDDHPAYFEAIDSKQPVRADDAHTHPATSSFSKGYLSLYGINSMLDLPLRLGEDVVGVLCCEHVGKVRAWTRDEEEFGMTVAAIVLIYLENERRIAVERELQQLNAELERRVEQRTRQMAAAEQRLGYMMTSVSAVMFACDAGGDFRSTFVSPNIEMQLGYPTEKYLTNPTFWIEHLHPDDQGGGKAAMQQAVRDGAASYEYRFRLPNGSYRWFRDDYTLMRGQDGKPFELVGCCIDVHDRRIAEQAAEAVAEDLRRILETANAPIVGEDIHCRINVWNACAERLTGYKRSEAMGRRLSDFGDAESRSTVIGAFANALAGKGAPNFEFPLRAKDGGAVHLLLSASARRDAGGNIVGVIAVGQDITEHREAQRRSLRAQRLESIGTLAGGVAHDVNNSIAPILLATGLLRERHPESADLVDLMEASARRGGSMVQQLLTFARGVDGKRVPVRPQILLAELGRIVKSTFPKNIQLHFACDPVAPAIVGDSTQLHQVLLNLCVNARDAMPQGGQMAVEVVREDLTAADVAALGDGKPGAHVRVRILDTGVGIAPELIDRIFEPFFSTKSPEQGTGLGLSTTLGIVRSHGGFMRVQSQVGQGSTFTVYLPAGVDGMAIKEIPSCVAEPYRGQGQTVLLVDDEPIVRNVVKRLLIVLGFTAEVAADGATALAILRDPQKQIALVITDLHMPGMDGLELTREIRRVAPQLPVVLASGFTDKADQDELDELAFAAQLYKPFGVELLTETLRATVG